MIQQNIQNRVGQKRGDPVSPLDTKRLNRSRNASALYDQIREVKALATIAKREVIRCPAGIECRGLIDVYHDPITIRADVDRLQFSISHLQASTSCRALSFGL